MYTTGVVLVFFGFVVVNVDLAGINGVPEEDLDDEVVLSLESQNTQNPHKESEMIQNGRRPNEEEGKLESS